ncbi:hypothetical protein AVEN_263803-1 [Araneus ventricosus]|uniref:RNase H type-1 domain-containing protein n=1 Tax=Araneus ventricosus TaxID=182803 RepID=A0A4Y2TJ83_ARAVE|nr:hypothetical protein AVEN_263803-1 [Araneus ventricosus]
MVEDVDETPETRSDERNVYNRMLIYDFLTLLGFRKNIINRIDRIQKRLQDPSMNCNSAALDLKALKDYFNNDRECIVNEALKIGEVLCEEWNVQFEKRPRKKENAHAGEEAADLLAKKSTLEGIPTTAPRNFLKGKVHTISIQLWQNEWDNGDTGRNVHLILPKVKTSTDPWERPEIVISTGHGPFPTYLKRFSFKTNDCCGWDGSKLEEQTDFAYCVFENGNLTHQWLFKLSKKNSFFRTELLAIKEACIWASKNNNNVKIWSDSESGFKAVAHFQRQAQYHNKSKPFYPVTPPFNSDELKHTWATKATRQQIP